MTRTVFAQGLFDQIRFGLPGGHRVINGLTERRAQSLCLQTEERASNDIQFGIGHIVLQTVQLRTQLLRR